MTVRLTVALAALVSCSDGGDPSFGLFEGTWAGTYTTSGDTTVFQAELRLTQSEDQVLGDITISSGRSATVSGTASGARLEAIWSYTDACGGLATTTADLVPPDLIGTYQSTDCDGETTGEYTLTKQE